MYSEAIAEFRKAATLSTSSEIQGSLGHAYAVSGSRDEAEKLLAELKDLSLQKYVSPYDIALIYIGLGQMDRAFEWLQKAYQMRTGLIVYLKVNPEFDSLHSDPRYTELVRKIGFPQ